MSEMKALDKLRNAKCEGLPCITCQTLADEIEREIAEQYMAHPLDWYAECVSIGDTLQHNENTYLVNTLIWDGKNWYASDVIASSDWVPVRRCVHVKPRTIEDVLRDVLNDEMTKSLFEEVREQYIAKYADEIRELMEGDAE